MAYQAHLAYLVSHSSRESLDLHKSRKREGAAKSKVERLPQSIKGSFPGPEVAESMGTIGVYDYRAEVSSPGSFPSRRTPRTRDLWQTKPERNFLFYLWPALPGGRSPGKYVYSRAARQVCTWLTPRNRILPSGGMLALNEEGSWILLADCFLAGTIGILAGSGCRVLNYPIASRVRLPIRGCLRTFVSYVFRDYDPRRASNETGSARGRCRLSPSKRDLSRRFTRRRRWCFCCVGTMPDPFY